MTHATINIPARTHLAPRGAEPLAHAAFAAMGILRQAGSAVLDGLRSRHLLARAAGDVSRAHVACNSGMGSIKG